MAEKKESNKVTLPIRVRKDSLQKFRELATKEGLRSANTKMSKVLEEYIKNVDIQGGSNDENKTD